MKIFLDNGKKFADASAKTIKLPKADQYQLEAEVFSRAVRGKEKLEFGVDDAILQARVIDAVFRSEKSGGWEKVVAGRRTPLLPATRSAAPSSGRRRSPRGPRAAASRDVPLTRAAIAPPTTSKSGLKPVSSKVDDVVLRPVADAGLVRRDVGDACPCLPAPARRRRPAPRSCPPSNPRGVWHSPQWPGPLHQIGAAIDAVARRRVGHEGLAVDVEELPEAEAAPDVEREGQFVRLAGVGDRRQRVEITP